MKEAQDFEFLNLAVKIALQAQKQTSPNPKVGAVLVKDNQVIAQGRHEVYGGAHAEVNCFTQAGNIDFSTCTLYVTLEPCCHTNKKTPPCTKLLIEKKIGRIVIGALDANPEVSGNGVELLKEAGLNVELFPHPLCQKIIEGFNFWINEKRPFVSLKWAQTLDGKMSTLSMDSKWITNIYSRKKAHQLRRMHDVLITGAKTIRVDNPRFTARYDDEIEYFPHLLIMTSKGEFSYEEEVFNIYPRNKITLFCSQKLISNPLNLEFVEFNEENFSEVFEAWMERKKFISAFVEAGPKIMNFFIKKKYFERIHCFIAPMILGQGQSFSDEIQVDKIANSMKFRNVEWNNFSTDLYFTARKEYV